MTIDKFNRMAHGVGGSYTRWQSKPPSHAVYWIETDEGQTTVKAYDLTERIGRDDDTVIDDGAMGPGNKPFASEVDYSDMSDGLQEAIRQRIVEDFEERQ